LVLIGYFQFYLLKFKKQQLEILLMSLGLSGLIYLAIFSFMPLFENIYKISTNFITYDLRLKLFFDSPNQLAMALAPIIFAFFSLSVAQTDKVKKMAYFNLMFVFIILLFLTKSLGAILGVLISFAIYFLIKKFQKAKNFLRYSLYSLLFSSIFFPAVMTLIWGQPQITDRSSFASRIMIWQSARAILADNLILGVGPGNFQDKYLKYQEKFPPYLEWAVAHPHNTFLTFWSSGGIIAFIGFLLLFIWVIKNITDSDEAFNNSINLYLILYSLYFLIHSSVDTLYFKNDLSVVFWFFIALTILQKDINQNIIKSQMSS
jgi:O-antigen ligase